MTEKKSENMDLGVLEARVDELEARVRELEADKIEKD